MRLQRKIHQIGFRRIASFALIAVLSLSSMPLTATTVTAVPDNQAQSDQAIVHLLNRITYGPRPGDIERVKQMGVNAFIDQQLHPERIEDSAITEKVKKFDTLNQNTQELYSMQPKELVTELQEAK